MRISCLRLSPFYHPLAARCVVFLNDKKLTDCFFADDVEGWCMVYVVNEKNQHVFNIDNSELLTEKLTGDVRIVLPVSNDEFFESMRVVE